MTEIFFLSQIDRLKRRFGEKHFDMEFVKLASFEAHKMSDEWFQRAVDAWVGSRSVSKPPLIAEFKEAKLKEEKYRLDNITKEAARSLDLPAQNDSLKKILKDQFGGTTSVKEAIEWIQLQNRLREADDIQQKQVQSETDERIP